MAESASIAFGRYLRTLRQRRGLSLDRVSRLSEASPKPLDKGTLSRFERGLQRLGVQSLIPLGRIYEVHAEALIERLELDTELDRVGGPETSGKDFDTLRRMGERALHREARKWDAYACFRDAVAFLATASPRPDRALRDEALVNLATVARSLGKNEFALYELTRLERSGRLAPGPRAVVLDRISNCHRCRGDLDEADRYAAAAAAMAEDGEELRVLAYALFSRASVAIERADHARAIEFLRRAFRTHRDAANRDCLLAPSPSFEVSVLLHLAEAYFELGDDDKSRRAALAAKRLSRSAELPGGHAYAELALGRVDERAGRYARAIQRWKTAGESAERMNNKRLAFAAEFYVLRQATDRGMGALARASGRRLERLVPWVPANLPLVQEYRALNADPVSARSKRAAGNRGPGRGARPRPADPTAQPWPRAVGKVRGETPKST